MRFMNNINVGKGNGMSNSYPVITPVGLFLEYGEQAIFATSDLFKRILDSVLIAEPLPTGPIVTDLTTLDFQHKDAIVGMGQYKIRFAIFGSIAYITGLPGNIVKYCPIGRELVFEQIIQTPFCRTFHITSYGKRNHFCHNITLSATALLQAPERGNRGLIHALIRHGKADCESFASIRNSLFLVRSTPCLHVHMRPQRLTAFRWRFSAHALLLLAHYRKA